MVRVTYRNSNIQYMIANSKPKSVRDDWTITKKFRYNPVFNGDTPYAARDYFRENLSDPRNQDPTNILNAKIKSLHNCLHLQTNYDELVRQGLYDLTYPQFREVLRSWYQMMVRRFPEFREAAELEFARHARSWQDQPHRVTVDQ